MIARSAIGALLALAGYSAGAEAPRFSADELAARALEAESSGRSALARAENLRAALVLNPAAVAAIVDPMEARALGRALGRTDSSNGLHASWLMRGAVTRVTGEPSRRVAGFYNPLVDLWLLCVLREVDGEWRVADARLLDGEALRRGDRLWSDASEAPFAALADRHAASLAAFESAFGAASAWPVFGGEAFALAGGRISRWIDGLGAWRQDAAQLRAANLLVAAIREGRLARLPNVDAPAAAEIDALPVMVRRGATIIGAIRRGETVTLVIASAVAPELLLLVEPAGESHRVAVLNLANARVAGQAL